MHVDFRSRLFEYDIEPIEVILNYKLQRMPQITFCFQSVCLVSVQVEESGMYLDCRPCLFQIWYGI